jgi:hypothetical protein
MASILRGCDPGVDVDSVVAWAKAIRFDLLLLNGIMRGEISLQGACATSSPSLDRTDRLRMLPPNPFTEGQLYSLKAAGATAAHIEWAQFTVSDSVFLDLLLEGKLSIVGQTGHQWVWRAGHPTDGAASERSPGSRRDG